MPLETYHFNLTTRQWVISADDPSPIETNFPIFGNTDVRDFAVRFINNLSRTEIEVVTPVVSAQIAISDPSTPGTVITSATAGTADNNYFPFLLPISGFTAFLGSSVLPKIALCEFRIATATGVNRYRTNVYIAPNQTSDATVDPTVSDRALGAEEARGIYVPKEWPAGMVQVVTTASGLKFLNYPGDDGQWHLDPI